MIFMKQTPRKLVFELDARQIILVLIGLGVVCFMVYKIGVIAGSRSTREEMLQARLKEDPRRKIKAPSLLKEEKSANEEMPSSAIEGILQKAEEKDKESEQEKGPLPDEKKPDRPEKVKTTEEKKVTASEQKSSSIPAAATAPKAPEARYYVQVASFANVSDARKRAAELGKKGYSVIIVKADIPGKGTYHRVRLGPFSSISKAKSFALKFEKREKVSTFIPVD